MNIIIKIEGGSEEKRFNVAQFLLHAMYRAREYEVKSSRHDFREDKLKLEVLERSAIIEKQMQDNIVKLFDAVITKDAVQSGEIDG